MPHVWYSSGEVAAYLRVPEADVVLWARRAEIPCVRRGDRFFFRRIDVEVWASRRLLSGGAGPLQDYPDRSESSAAPESGDASVACLLAPERIAPALESRTRASVIRDLVAFAEQTGLLNYPADLLRAIEAREREGPTAMPGGVALLHPGHREPYLFEDSFLVFGRTLQEIPFGAPDGRPTRFFFLLCCTDDRQHLRALSRLCRICRRPEIPPALDAAETAPELFETLVCADAPAPAGRRALRGA